MPQDEFDLEKNASETSNGPTTLLSEDFFYDLGDQLNLDMGRRDGFCYGIACMVMQATLAGELPVLKARLVAINSLTKEEVNTLLQKHRAKEHEPYTEKEIDILAFFEGVSMYQNVDRQHSKLFEKYDWAQVGIAAGLIAPINLQDRYLNWKAQQNELTNEESAGPIASVFLSTAIFSKNDFINWLTLLTANLSTESINYPLSICLNNYEHTIQLTFNAENNRWTYTSGFDVYESDNASSIANIVFSNKCFAKDDALDHFVEPDKLVLTTEFFVPTQQLRVAKAHLNDWYMNDAIQAIYNKSASEIDDEQVEALNELFYLAINSGNVTLLNNLITNNIFLKKQSIIDAYGDPMIIAAHTSCNPLIMIELSRSNFDTAALVLSEHPACKRALELLQNTVVENFLTQLRQIDVNQLRGHESENNSLRLNMLWLLRDIGAIHQNQQLAALANEMYDLIYQLAETDDKEVDEDVLSTKLAVFTDLATLSNLSVENVTARLSNELISLNSRLNLDTREDKLLSTSLGDLLTSLRSLTVKSPHPSIKLNQLVSSQLINLIHDISLYHSPEKQKTEQLTQKAMETYKFFQRRTPRDPRTGLAIQPARTPISKK